VKKYLLSLITFTFFCNKFFIKTPSKGRCFKDQDCLNPSIQLNLWHGLPTGKCLASKITNKTRVCEINGWCPIENEIKKYFLLLITSINASREAIFIFNFILVLKKIYY
jgi:hypothetical protein